MSQPLVLTHFTALFLYSVFSSVVFGITHRDTPREMVRYGLKCFAWFVGGTFVAAWTMFIIRWIAMR